MAKKQALKITADRIERAHGMASPGFIAETGMVDAEGFVCTDLRFDILGNTPALATWVKQEGYRKVVQKRRGTWVESTEVIDETPPATIGMNWYGNSTSYNYAINTNGHTYHYVKASASTAQDKEQEMAQRHDFTFPYTGSQIAAALDSKIAELDSKIDALEALDHEALSALYDLERNDDLSKRTERTVRDLKRQREKLRLEATPYRQAGGKEFDLDLEDVEHFGLNKADVEPVKAKRKRRTKAEMEAAEGSSAA